MYVMNGESKVWIFKHSPKYVLYKIRRVRGLYESSIINIL